MEKYIIAVVLITALIFFIYIQHKKTQNIEHFQTEYIKDMFKYLDGLKKYNDDKKIKQQKIENEKSKKYKTMAKMRKEKIFITGATKGLGNNIAKFATKFKCPIYISGRKEKDLEKLVEELKKTNDNIYGSAADLTKDKELNKLFEDVKNKMGCPTIFINCAIASKSAAYISTKSEKDWKNEIDLNVKAMILLSQKVAYKMYLNKIDGRVINFSTYKSKNIKLNYMTPDKIVTESMQEKFSNVFSDEMFNYNIAITTIRLDEEVDSGNFKLIDINMKSSPLTKAFQNIFKTSPKKIIPVVEYTMRAPVKEITGKIISTDNFIKNRQLMPIVAPNKLKNDIDVYDNVILTKTIPRDNQDDYTTLTKQNPHEPSKKVKKFLKSNKKIFNKFNTMGKYDLILDNVIAKKIGVDEDQIVFFKTEFDAIKRLFELFVSSGSEIVSTNPPWAYLELCTIESKAMLNLTTLDNTKNKELDINYRYITFSPKTKIVYLSSPNNVSGQCLKNNRSWKKFLEKIPENVLIVIDQRYIDFVYETKELNTDNSEMLDAIELMKTRKNVIVFRSFNNFYSIENLELCYFIADNSITNFFKKSQVINPIDRFTEGLALAVIDDPYYEKTKKRIQDEKKRIFRILDKEKIDYYDSDSNFFLIETNSNRDIIMSEFESQKLILYNSFDGFNNFWTLPISTEKTNNKVLEIIQYDNLGN
jgi:histidinol-phosphate aminotransferase